MKIIKPTRITEEIIVSTNVHETAPEEYAPASTYVAGSFVHVVNGQKLDIYESLQNGNKGHDPATSLTWWVYRSSTYPEYASAVTYSKGVTVIDVANHLAYESLQDANQGNPPGASEDWWLEVASTNPWKPFDLKVGSQVRRTGSIGYEFLPGAVEGLALFNMVAHSVNIVLTDPDIGVVYDTSIELIDNSHIFDWYSYVFGEFIMKKNIGVTNLPYYPLATLELSVSVNDESFVSCGEIVFGKVTDIGQTQYSPTIEIVDYSKKDIDAFGNFIIVKRPFSKRVSIDTLVANSRIGNVQNVFEENRASPTVFIPTEEDALMGPYLTYGFYNRFSIVTQYPSHSIINIEIIGIT